MTKLAWLAAAAGAVGLLFAGSRTASASGPAPVGAIRRKDLEIEPPDPRQQPPVTSPTDVPIEVPVDAAQQLAAATNDVLWEIAERGGEGTETAAEKKAIELYQASEGLKVDGLYGPKTGLSFVRRGLVPPPPFYWPKQGEDAAKAEWRSTLLAKASDDPARSEEWQQIAAV